MPLKIDKHKIKSSFSKAAMQYDRYALMQKETAEELLKKLTPTHRGILDIGCGTGFLIHGLAKTFPKANIFGCDISHEMIDVAKVKGESMARKISLIVADGKTLPCKDETFGMVASNLAYQWIRDIKTAFSEAHRVLMPGGVFAFSTLGPKTLKELRCCYAEASARFNKDGLPPFMVFSDEQVIQSTMKSAGFKTVSIERKDIVKTDSDMWQLLKTMKSIGAGNPFKDGDKSLARGSLLKKMAEVYQNKFGALGSELGVKTPHPTSHVPRPNHIYATYEVMFVKAVKL